MEHVRVATYAITKGDFSDIVRLAGEPGAIGDIFKSSTGFARYSIADMGDSKFASISFWDSKEAAQAAAETAKSWVRDNLADRVSLEMGAVGDVGYTA
jgi:heme-degrading monooxygenase HmoA